MDPVEGRQNSRQDALDNFIDAGPVRVNTILLIEVGFTGDTVQEKTVEHGIVFSRQCRE